MSYVYGIGDYFEIDFAKYFGKKDYRKMNSHFY